jgi:hypothetical protein
MRINPFNDHANVFVNPYDNVLNKLRQQKLNESENYYKNKYNNLNKKLNVLTKYLEEASSSAYSADGRGVGSPTMGTSTGSDQFAMLGRIPPSLLRGIPKDLIDDVIKAFKNIFGDNLQQADNFLDDAARAAEQVITIPKNVQPSGFIQIKGVGMVPLLPPNLVPRAGFPPTKFPRIPSGVPGVYIHNGRFWFISQPSPGHPNGVVYFFDPAFGDFGWQVFRGPAFQNPWNFPGIPFQGGEGWQVSM